MKPTNVKIKPPRLTPVKEGKPDKYGFIPRKREVKFFEDELPEVKTWNVGEEYTLLIKVKQVGTEISDDEATKGKIVGEFKVLSVGVANTTGK